MEGNNNYYKSETIYKIVYNEGEGDKSPRAYIIGFDSNYLHIKFKDGMTKSIAHRFIKTISELGDEHV